MDEIFKFLQGQLTGRLNSDVGYISSGNWDPISFDDGQLTFLLANLEEEKIMNRPGRYHKVAPSGRKEPVQPEIRLNLYLLIVAKFSDYLEALKQLTGVARFFQQHRFFTPSDSLPEDVHRLSLELITPTFSEQNELWSALKVAYHPSLLYKVKLLYIQSEEADLSTEVLETESIMTGQ